MEHDSDFEEAFKDALHKADVLDITHPEQNATCIRLFDDKEAVDFAIAVHNCMENYGLVLGIDYEVDVDGCEVTVEEC